MSNEVKRAIDGGLSGLTVSERQIRAIMRMTRTEAAPPPRRKHRFVPVLAALMVMLIVGVSAILPGVSGPQDDLTSQVPTGQAGGFSTVNPALAEQEGDPSPEDGEGDTPVAPPESAAPTATVTPEPVPTPAATHLDIATRTDLTIPAPTATPTMAPTATPTMVPTATPTMAPTATPTMAPTATPTMAPTATPTMAPTATPTMAPTATPTMAPTATPTMVPTATPTMAPTATPTMAPTATPTMAPTATPTMAPTATPTMAPTATPTMVPTVTPTMAPTATPTMAPTATPTMAPTATPTPVVTPVPTATPTPAPTATPAPLTMPAQEEVLYEDDRLAVTLVHSEFDTAGTSVQLRVLPKEPGKLVLTTDPAATAQDGRALLHLAAQADAFDSASVKTADWKSAQDMASQQEGRLCSMTTTWTKQPDGSYLLQADGLMVYHFDQQVSVYVALTLTDSDAASSELLFRLESPRLTGFSEAKSDGFLCIEQSNNAFMDTGATVYQHDSGHFATIRFKYLGTLPEDTMIRIIGVNGVDSDYGAGLVGLHGQGSSSDVLSARIMCRNMPEELRTMAVEAYDYSSGEILFRVMYRQQLYQGVPPTLAPLPQATPTPPPIITSGVVFEDDYLVVTLESSTFAYGETHAQMVISVKDASRYVLVTDAAQQTSAGQKVILVSAQAEAFRKRDGEMALSLSGFDIQDVLHRSNKILRDPDQQYDHISSLNCTLEPMADGSVHLDVRGDLTEHYRNGLYMINALSFTDTERKNGRTEIITIESPKTDEVTIARKLNVKQITEEYSPNAQWAYYYDLYDIIYLHFSHEGGVPEGAVARLTSINGVAGEYGEAAIVPSEWYNKDDVLVTRILQEHLPENAHTFTVEGVDPATGEVLFEAVLEAAEPVDEDAGTENLLPVPAPTGWVNVKRTVSLYPTPTPAPIPTVTPVPDMILYSDDRVTLTGKARSFDGVHAQAELLLTAENALQPGDVTARLRVVDPDDVEHSPQEMQVQCEAVDGGVRILLSADSVQFFGRSVEAAGTITLTGEDGQETLCKIRLPLGDQVSPVTSGNLLAGERPKKYSHYKGRLYAFGDYAYVNADFRYHDTLLAGTQIRLAAVDGVEGDFGSITLTQDVPGGELLSARIRAEGLPAKVHSFLCRVISPDGEPIFDFELKTEVVLPIRNESFNPNDPWYGDDYDLLDGLKPLYTPNGWAVGAPSTTKPPSYFDWITDGMQSGPNIDYGFGFGGW